MKELIHFAHGNGFPALCYSQLLNHLETHYDYCYIDKIGHNEDYPVTENWHDLVLEVIGSIEDKADKPVIALGHSLGGVLSLLAAIERPELFKALILLDSPLIGPFKSNVVKLAKAVGLIDRVTPAHKTRGRRQHWQTKEQLLDYLKSRELFNTFDEKCLEDYVNYGLELKEDGYHLRFNRVIEYQIYRTIPHIIPLYKNSLRIPTVLIYGDKSTVVGSMEIRYMKKHFNIQCVKTKGSHLFPMEDPLVVANQIVTVINAIIYG